MADDIDVANDLMLAQVSRALELRQQAAKGMVGSSTCVECGDDIPDGRKKLGFKLCVPCAEEAERRKQLFGG